MSASRPSSSASSSGGKAADVPAIQWAVRDEANVRFLRRNVNRGTGAPDEQSDHYPSSEDSYVKYSSSGRYLATIEGSVVVLRDTEALENVVARCDASVANGIAEPHAKSEHSCRGNDVMFVDFSPDGNFLVTWQKPAKVRRQEKNVNPTTDSNQHNLLVWNCYTGEVVLSLYEKEMTLRQWPCLKWSDDNRICARVVTNQIQFFDGMNPGAGVQKRLHVRDVLSFELAPNTSKHCKYVHRRGQKDEEKSDVPACKVACFVPAKKSQPASVRVFEYPQIGERDHTAMMSFFKADEAQLRWNSDASAVLIQSTTDHDSSNKSYYGETGLHLLFADNSFSCTVPFGTNKGPVHDAQWHPNGRQFIVLQGIQPAQALLFKSQQCTAVFQFGRTAANNIKWSPHGRFVCLCGFGSLQGEMHFWDINKKKKIGMARDRDGAKSFEWAPDGRTFTTAVLRPWRRVDNGYKIFTYAGEKIAEKKIEKLFQVLYRPALRGVYPNRPQSPRLTDKRLAEQREQVKAAAQPKAYVPPHLRNKQKSGTGKSSTPSLQERLRLERQSSGPKFIKQGPVAVNNGVVTHGGVAADDQQQQQPKLTKQQLKNKKRAERRRRAKEEREAEKAAAEAAAAAEKQAAIEAQQAKIASMSDEQKRARMIKKLRKKIAQADKLVELAAGGQQLDAAQQAKVDSAAELRADLEELLDQQSN